MSGRPRGRCCVKTHLVFTASQQHPFMRLDEIAVVFARCSESGGSGIRDLTTLGVPFRVYQKAPCNNSHTFHTLAQLPPASVRMLDYNAGDECSAYLQYIHDEYDQLPAGVVFLQYASEHQQMLSTVSSTVRTAAAALERLGYVALSRHTFEGRWPAPCEHAGKQQTFARCSAAIYKDMDVPPPATFRFYANGLFAVTRERIRQRSRSWYADMVSRLSGRAPSRCDGPDTRRRVGAATKLVGDCHVLEKSWHVLFGERPTLPAAHAYDGLRAPNVTLRGGDASTRLSRLGTASAVRACRLRRWPSRTTVGCRGTTTAARMRMSVPTCMV